MTSNAAAILDRPAALEPRHLGTVFVTGGSSGLGAAVADAVTAAGGTPGVLDRVPPPGGLPYAAVDLSDSSATAAAVDDLVDRVGPPPGSEERRVGKECRSRLSPYH